MEEDEKVKYHHQLNGHEFEQTLGNSEGQRRLMCSVHGVEKSQTQLSNHNNKYISIIDSDNDK